MSQYFFILGNTPELSLAELQALLPESASLTQITPEIATAELADDQAALALMDISGGLVKVMRYLKDMVAHQPEPLQAELFEAMMEYLQASGQEKVTYAVAEIGRDHLPALSPGQLKGQIIKAGYRARYVESPRAGLSSSVLSHHKNITEFVLLQTAEGIALAQTVAIQDIDRWSFRDRAKPYADRKKGMLPPKVARMMINIGLAHLDRQVTQNKPAVLYDPFCGTGTVLTEALLRDCHVIGSDLDSVAVTGSQANLEWLIANLEDQTIPELFFQVFQSDVSNVQPSQLKKVPDMIVSEPFLGKPRARVEMIPNIMKGLHKLYWGAFKNWTHILPNGGVVVIVLPLIDTGRQHYTMQGLIDKLPDLGYTTLLTPILYGRPQAITHRQLYVFRLNK